MIRTKTSMWLAGMLSVLCITGTALAQTGPINGGTGPVGQGNSVQITDQSLPEMMKKLGYQVQELKSNKGTNYWKVSTQQEGWGFVVEIMPTRGTNQQIIGFWFISDLGGKINNTGGLSSASLIKLMEQSHRMAPFFFSFNPATQHIAMNYEYPSSKISEDNLKKQFTSFFAKIRETYSLWNTNALQGAGGGAVLPPKENPFPKPDPGKVNGPIGAQPGKDTVLGSKWAGTENLQGFGKLTFEFNADGKATMFDSAGVSQGTWTQSGNKVTVQFFDGKVTYTGTINGTIMQGTATNTAGASWTFNITRQAATAVPGPETKK